MILQKWFGRCSSCGEWNTCVEEVERKDTFSKRPPFGMEITKQKPMLLRDIEGVNEERIDMKNEELNRVLGVEGWYQDH